MRPLRRSASRFVHSLILIASLLGACSLERPSAFDSAPIPPIITEPPPETAFETLAALETAVAPPRDLADLTRRYKGVVDLAAEIHPPYQAGDVETFWYKDHGSNQVVQVSAALIYRSETLNLWLEVGAKADEAQVSAAARVIEEQILPTNRAFFGDEWRPGIDGDERINFLHLKKIGGNVAGYFSAADEFPTAVNPYSNERELLYISLDSAPIGSEAYYHVIAHELQHMIHWNTDANEDAWLNEGLSELATFINGYPSAGFDEGYARQTDVQLNDFAYEGDAVQAHYGSAYLLAAYFLSRFGEEATRSLVRHPENGIASFGLVLKEQSAPAGTALTFDDFFAQWLAATYLAGEGRGQDIYRYQGIDVPSLTVSSRVHRFPTTAEAAVHQYGADFIAVESDEPVTLVFTGTRQVNLLDTAAHSGQAFWSSFPADGSDVTLTQAYDLTGLEKATLTFWTWFDLEAGWDYAYLALSSDGGASWQPLETGSTTRDDPQGNSFGPGYTGKSGGGDVPVWIQERVDLSSFAGQQVLLRFETVTDDTIHGQGLAIDDIAIPELGFVDDVENGVGGWEAIGFARHANILPQQFIIQLLLLGEDEVTVQGLALDASQQGRWRLPLNRTVNEAVLIVSGSTPVTRQPAAYRYSLAQD